MFEHPSHHTGPLNDSGYGILTLDEIAPDLPLVIASHPTFSALIGSLSSLEPDAGSLVLTPELITSVGPLDLHLQQDRVERDITTMCQLSTARSGVQ